MAKNNQKKEKAKRNLENARRFKKKPAGFAKRRGFSRPSAGGGGTAPGTGEAAV